MTAEINIESKIFLKGSGDKWVDQMLNECFEVK